MILILSWKNIGSISFQIDPYIHIPWPRRQALLMSFTTSEVTTFPYKLCPHDTTATEMGIKQGHNGWPKDQSLISKKLVVGLAVWRVNQVKDLDEVRWSLFSRWNIEYRTSVGRSRMGMYSQFEGNADKTEKEMWNWVPSQQGEGEQENKNKDIGIEEEQNGLSLPNVPALDPILIRWSRKLKIENRFGWLVI